MLDFNILIVFIGSHFCLRNALVNMNVYALCYTNKQRLLEQRQLYLCWFHGQYGNK